MKILKIFKKNLMLKEEELKNYIIFSNETVEAYHKRTAIDKIKIEVQDDLKNKQIFYFQF